MRSLGAQALSTRRRTNAEWKKDNALARSWKKYGVDSGDEVEEGDIVVLGDSHVTLANKSFNRKRDKYFEGLGGNQRECGEGVSIPSH